MAAIDTNLLVRILAKDDPIQTAKAKAYVEANAPAWVSLPVLVETFYTLESFHKWDKATLLGMLHGITNSRHFALQDQAAVAQAARLWQTAKTGFMDCLNVSLATAHGEGPLATFDKDASKLPGAFKP